MWCEHRSLAVNSLAFLLGTRSHLCSKIKTGGGGAGKIHSVAGLNHVFIRTMSRLFLTVLYMYIKVLGSSDFTSKVFSMPFPLFSLPSYIM